MKAVITLIFAILVGFTTQAQFWRHDGDFDVLADSIENTILLNKGKKLKITLHSESSKTNLTVKWISDSIICVTAKSRNVTYHNENGTYNKIYMITNGNALCMYDNDKKVIKYCPRVLSEDRTEEYNEICEKVEFTYDKRNQITMIYDTSLEESRIAKIK